MLYIQEATMVKSASDGSILSPESRNECQSIMDAIYKEDPSYWPYGLDINAHDGGMYMVRQASTDAAIGFVGWQERNKGMKKVGYYTVGMLPAYRGNGYAKAALSNLIQIKSAGVDQVLAFVVPHNKPSIALADSIAVPVVHNV